MDRMEPCPQRTQAGAEACWGGAQRHVGDWGVEALGRGFSGLSQKTGWPGCGRAGRTDLYRRLGRAGGGMRVVHSPCSGLRWAPGAPAA